MPMREKKLCPKCEYEWKAKIKNPKSCPRCKTRLDIIRK